MNLYNCILGLIHLNAKNPKHDLTIITHFTMKSRCVSFTFQVYHSTPNNYLKLIHLPHHNFCSFPRLSSQVRQEHSLLCADLSGFRTERTFYIYLKVKK